MSKYGTASGRILSICALIVAACMMSPTTTAFCQEPATTDPPAQTASEETPAAAPQEEAPANESPSEESTTDQTAAEQSPTATPNPSNTRTPQTPALSAPTGTANTAADDTGDTEELTNQAGQESLDDEVPSRQSSLPAGATEESLADQALRDLAAPTGGAAESTWYPLLLALGIVALFVIPILLGNFLARTWRMPDHGWKFSLVIGATAAAAVVCFFGEFKFGPDLAGGITLIYELADAGSAAAVDDGPSPTGPPGAEAQIRSGDREFKLTELIGALKRRLDPDGTKEITVREYGRAIEIIIPETGDAEMEFVKRRITDLGQLEFRITADSTRPSDRPIITLANQLPPGVKDVMQAGNKVGEWVAYDVDAFLEDTTLVRRMAGDTPEALVLMDPFNVTGEYLTSATKGLDERANPAVHFSFDRTGSYLFGQLTGENRPNATTPDVFRHLGIILDKTLLSAPRIITKITERGMISGESMDEREVEHIIEVLNAGSLPAALNKTPISQESISPTLGAETIESGKLAIGASFLAVMVFMLVYYRFAGVVACLALALNLLLVLALMVLIKAAFTLPGLAGLVLTIGMAVDANVLIYERIREELRSGAALRMAIRNGFGRAMSAIIDSNVTTIITGIVLFYIGTDQVKGFAVTLILGILTSMFTAIFFARLVFDVAERRGWITNVKMMKILAHPNYDFLGVRWPAIGASLVLIAIGLAAVFARGKQLLDIDFTGGSSVSFILNESAKMPIADVRAAFEGTDLADKNLLIVERGTTNTRYQIDTSEQSVDNVKDIIRQTFGPKLMTYSIEFRDLKPYTEGGFTGSEATLLINAGGGYEEEDGMSREALQEALRGALVKAGHAAVQPELSNPNYRPGSVARFKEWNVRFVGLDQNAVQSMLEQLQQDMSTTPLFPLANTIGGRVSANMQLQAMYAVGISLLGVVAYLWLRFQRVTYGVAAGVAVVHDVLVTIGMMALSAYIVQQIPAVASFLKLEAFQINLTIVAALLTIIGYSLNDTIVTFDRLREIKGKSPRLTSDMVNSSVNQCLSRTILTATTVFIVVVILYFFGGEGIHSFAFAFLVGVVAGTYSTVYIAAPVLLWLSGTSIESTASTEAAA
jgi:SecD/SecF fusion protein